MKATHSFDTDTLTKRAKARVGFKIHFTVYVSVIGFLWVLWFMTGVRHPWPIYPTLGWGIGVLFHYLVAYCFFDRMVEEEKQKQVDEEKLI